MKWYCGFNIILVMCTVVLLALFNSGIIVDVSPVILCIPFIAGGINFLFTPLVAALKMSSTIDREEADEYIDVDNDIDQLFDNYVKQLFVI